MHYAWQAGIRFFRVSFSIRPAVFLAGGGARMKHLFRQDLQDYQDLFWTRISLSCPSRLPGRSFFAKPG
jgi:hypothetical protein